VTLCATASLQKMRKSSATVSRVASMSYRPCRLLPAVQQQVWIVSTTPVMTN
jgi:hypothetical protein